MKNYTVTVTYVVDICNIEAKNKSDAKRKARATFKDEHNIILKRDEMEVEDAD